MFISKWTGDNPLFTLNIKGKVKEQIQANSLCVNKFLLSASKYFIKSENKFNYNKQKFNRQHLNFSTTNQSFYSNSYHKTYFGKINIQVKTMSKNFFVFLCYYSTFKFRLIQADYYVNSIFQLSLFQQPSKKYPICFVIHVHLLPSRKKMVFTLFNGSSFQLIQGKKNRKKNLGSCRKRQRTYLFENDKNLIHYNIVMYISRQC